MRYERIEIDYKPIDLGANPLALDIKSNILKKVSNYSCSYSYTYDVPLTQNNKNILGSLLVAGARNKKVRQFLPATYYRDGLKIFDGKCYVSEIGIDSASLVFLFGINNALQDLKSDDVTLDKLWNDEDNDFHAVSGSTGINIDYVTRELPFEDYDDVLKYDDMASADESTLTCPAVALRNTYESETSVIPYYTRIPYAIRIKSIFEQINKRYGLVLSNLLEDGGRYLDDYLYFKTSMKRSGAFAMVSNNYTYYLKGNYQYCRAYAIPSQGEVFVSSSTKMKNADGDYPDVNTDRYVKSFNSLACVKSVTINWNFSASDTSGDIVYVCGDVEYVVGAFGSGASSGTITFDPREKNYNHVIEKGDMAYVAFRYVDYSHHVEVTTFSSAIDMYFDEDGAEKGLFNVFDTLPSTNAVTFINDYAFAMFGKFPINTLKGGNELYFTNLEEIAERTPYDWSEKLQNKDLKQYYTIDGLARKNWLKYKEDESEEAYDADHAFDKSIDVDDETLDDDNDYFETITSYAFPHTDGECWFLERNGDDDLNPQPRYMHLTRTQYLNYDGTNYAQMVNSSTLLTDIGNHKVTTDTLSDPYRIECKMLLNTLDLATLDMSRPVYLSQLGSLFFIDEIKVAENDICTVKLTRLKV